MCATLPTVTSKRRFQNAGHRQRTLRDSARHNPWATRAAVIAAVATLLASVGGLVFSGLSTRAATEQSRQVQTAQASERFSRSVEQLGSSSMTVRIGAVYSFGRLIRDSDADQQTIDQVLSSFVRIQTAAARSAAIREGQENPVPPADLLAAFTVLDQQKDPSDSTSDARAPMWHSMLLHDVDLSSFNLMKVEMRKSDLSFAHLAGAYLSSAKLNGADLSSADLTGAHLDSADLSSAHLNLANLSGADLTDANLTGANLTYANLTDAKCSVRTRWPAIQISHPQCRGS
jgi:uncharacterized protein YjbI with pentapeptide repeats